MSNKLKKKKSFPCWQLVQAWTNRGSWHLPVPWWDFRPNRLAPRLEKDSVQGGKNLGAGETKGPGKIIRCNFLPCLWTSKQWQGCWGFDLRSEAVEGQAAGTSASWQEHVGLKEQQRRTMILGYLHLRVELFPLWEIRPCWIRIPKNTNTFLKYYINPTTQCTNCLSWTEQKMHWGQTVAIVHRLYGG